jgi:hypothetical protein
MKSHSSAFAVIAFLVLGTMVSTCTWLFLSNYSLKKNSKKLTYNLKVQNIELVSLQKKLDFLEERILKAKKKSVLLSQAFYVLKYEYGYKPCKHMERPLDIRYPRLKTDFTIPREKLVNCVHNLVGGIARGQLLFVLFGGLDLQAGLQGGGNPNKHDGDLDIRLTVSSNRTRSKSMIEFCPGQSVGIFETFFSSPMSDGIESWKNFIVNEKRTRINSNIFAQGRFSSPMGYHDENHLKWLKSKHNHQSWMINEGLFDKNDAEEVWLHGNLHKAFPGQCLGEWEKYPVLLPGNRYDLHYFGGSYWVPPPNGGMKGVGHRFRGFFNPAESLWAQKTWPVKTRNSLALIDTLPKDDQIAMNEFMKYVRNSSQVNQKWLDYTIENDPCMILNAQIHYNHTYHYSIIGLDFRDRCGSDMACNRKNWLKFKQNYKGVPYIDVDNRFVNRPKSEIDPINQTQKYCRERLKF